jgi:hypothetical protein
MKRYKQIYKKKTNHPSSMFGRSAARVAETAGAGGGCLEDREELRSLRRCSRTSALLNKATHLFS